ncbi:MAG: septum site-determining protein MinC [Roseibium sp.]
MKFKGKSFIAIVLTPEPPYEDWFQEVDRIIARTPGFFIDRPIILDVRGTKIPIEDLENLLEGLSERSVRVMGIDGISGTRLKPGMPPSFGGGRLTADVEVPEPDPEAAAFETANDKKAERVKKDTMKEPVASEAAQVNGSSSKRPTSGSKAKAKSGKSTGPNALVEGASIVVTEPVRSGQRIMHPEGDVTVIGSVSSGAEIIAGGSIHVYGALRGRALAGVSGEDGARIFCSKLDAELVSINGLYKVADDFDGTLRNSPAQIRFENETLVFEQLS